MHRWLHNILAGDGDQVEVCRNIVCHLCEARVRALIQWPCVNYACFRRITREITNNKTIHYLHSLKEMKLHLHHSPEIVSGEPQITPSSSLLSSCAAIGGEKHFFGLISGFVSSGLICCCCCTISCVGVAICGFARL